MAVPKTRDELEAAGWIFDTLGRCRGTRCKADLWWWWSPKGKRVPMNEDLTPHHATCPDVAQFRKPKESR